MIIIQKIISEKLVLLIGFGCLLFLGLIGTASAWVPTSPDPTPPPETWNYATSGTLLEGDPFGGTWKNTYAYDSVCWSGIGESSINGLSPYIIFRLYFNNINADLVAIAFNSGNLYRITTLTVSYTDGTTFEKDFVSVGYSKYALDPSKSVRWVQLSYKAPIISFFGGANLNGRAVCDFDYCGLRSN
ncbi:MAG: hypothetical protein EU548_09940 [Promethearchaeota archaeon]|nr:MAG: hypothetical protein EU548_09940 [Candidatus Lokiarchaeota archaeon]